MSRLAKCTRSAEHAGFTLMEMLTVIAIIAILAGLLFTGVTHAKARARIAQAQAEAREIAKAWKSYYALYGDWPSGYAGANREMTAAAVQILQGIDTVNNPQRVKFLDVDTDTIADGFEDPWGMPYVVDMTRIPSVSEERYKVSVFFPNRRRYYYEL